MLNCHTLDEVTCDQDFASENTPITEPTIEPNLPVPAPTNEYTTSPIESNVPVLDSASLTPRRTTRSCHPPRYLKDYTYSLPKLQSSSPINNTTDSQSLTSFTNHPDHEFDLMHYKSTTSPLYPTEKLRLTEGKLLSDPTYYRKLVGKLNFLANTRMDIAYSVQHLSQFMQSPREPHLKAAYHVLRYLQHDPTLGVFINNKSDVTISAYCDSDWASCPDSRKSMSGYFVLMGDSPISWKFKKQPTVSLSSAEAEYRAIRQVVGEVVWLERLLGELSMKEPEEHMNFEEINTRFRGEELQKE
uniref:Reverse transcriptase Ty1/copia-type domain-containing protein n=1 Tax=Solanum lycopersicum TaxID=4081 RepID=A0A3Q7GKB4_SOLLC